MLDEGADRLVSGVCRRPGGHRHVLQDQQLLRRIGGEAVDRDDHRQPEGAHDADQVLQITEPET